MRIAVGSDHAGVELKAEVVSFLKEWGHEVEDFGTHDSKSVDFPDYAIPVARAVASEQFDRGILVCSNGVGVSIVANKVKGARAALCSDTFSSRRAREHTKANVLCLGELVIGKGLARDVVEAWLTAEYLGDKPDGEKYARRLAKLNALDEDRR